MEGVPRASNFKLATYAVRRRLSISSALPVRLASFGSSAIAKEKKQLDGFLADRACRSLTELEGALIQDHPRSQILPVCIVCEHRNRRTVPVCSRVPIPFQYAFQIPMDPFA